MVKGFTPQEREFILEQLYEEGKRLFSLYGLKKTSVAQLTRKAGIAQGSFYLFFNSKEELYFDLLEREEKKLKNHLIPYFADSQMSSKKFKNLLLDSLLLVDQNPLIRRMFFDEEIQLVLRKLPPERMEQHISKDSNDLLPFIELWQEQGIIIDQNPDAIAAVIRAFFTVILHKREIGEDIYNEAVELLAESIAEKIMVKGR